MKGLFHILAVLAFLSGKSWSQDDIELALEEMIIPDTEAVPEADYTAGEEPDDYYNVEEDIIVAEHVEPMGPDTLPPDGAAAEEAAEETAGEEPGNADDIELALEGLIIPDEPADAEDDYYIVEEVIEAEHVEPLGPDTLPPAEEPDADTEPDAEPEEPALDDIELAVEDMIIPDYVHQEEVVEPEEDNDYYIVEEAIVPEHVEPVGESPPPEEEPEYIVEEVIVPEHVEPVAKAKSAHTEQQSENVMLKEPVSAPASCGRSLQQFLMLHLLVLLMARLL